MMSWSLLCLFFSQPTDALSTSSRLRSATATTAPGEYYWPSGRGAASSYSRSPYAGPRNLTASFAWSWHHPKGRFHTLPYGTAIDDSKNIYLTTDTAIWKLSPTGSALWSFVPEPRATIFSAASLLNGRVHFTTLDGHVWAISMESGEKLWSTKVCKELNHDNGFVSAHRGVVVASADAELFTHGLGKGRLANRLVLAVNATNGQRMWSFRPQVPVWNFLASFPDDGTVLYQDWEGRAYRHRMHDGKLLWKAGGWEDSWTDGSPLYADGVFYTVAAKMWQPDDPGQIRAHDLADGRLLWQAHVPMPPNNALAIGRLTGQKGLSLVSPAGYQGVKGGSTGIFAFDAARGQKQWTFIGPSQKNHRQAGEMEGFLERFMAGASTGYVTNPWSAPTVDVEGTVYVGHEDGLFFALRDENGDGAIEGDAEVSTFDTGAAFTGSSSPAHAPGLLAVASCDSLFVFQTAV